MVQAFLLAESGGIFSVSHELHMGVSAFGGALTCESCQRPHLRAGAAMGEYFMAPTIADIHRMEPLASPYPGRLAHEGKSVC